MAKRQIIASRGPHDFVEPDRPPSPRKDIHEPMKTPAYPGADRTIHDTTRGPLSASRSKRGLPMPGDPFKPRGMAKGRR